MQVTKSEEASSLPNGDVAGEAEGAAEVRAGADCPYISFFISSTYIFYVCLSICSSICLLSSINLALSSIFSIIYQSSISIKSGGCLIGLFRKKLCPFVFVLQPFK